MHPYIAVASPAVPFLWSTKPHLHHQHTSRRRGTARSTIVNKPLFKGFMLCLLPLPYLPAADFSYQSAPFTVSLPLFPSSSRDFSSSKTPLTQQFLHLSAFRNITGQQLCRTLHEKGTAFGFQRPVCAAVQSVAAANCLGHASAVMDLVIRDRKSVCEIAAPDEDILLRRDFGQQHRLAFLGLILIDS